MYHLSPCNYTTCSEELEAHRESVPGILLELWYQKGEKSTQLNMKNPQLDPFHTALHSAL